MEKKQRKGAWTKEEDTLLRNCIDKFGEGKWHKIPLRAGLERCRKSCRLRWLNYLSPKIKRGYFTKDEVDLLLRLHKLLGNRWSLIAGRLPGRTANDVKNFWNSHINMLKKKKSSAGGESGKKTEIISENDILIKPQPWRFSNKPSSSASASLPQLQDVGAINTLEFPSINNNVPFSLTEQELDECIRWWHQTEMDEKDDAYFPTQNVSNLLLDADFLDLTIFD